MKIILFFLLLISIIGALVFFVSFIWILSFPKFKNSHGKNLFVLHNCLYDYDKTLRMYIVWAIVFICYIVSYCAF
jgi:hypothetical protein